MRMLRATLTISLLALGLSSAHADVSGTVMTTDGFPLSKAQVRLFAPETGDEQIARLSAGVYDKELLASGETDRYGRFRIETPKGTNVVIVEVHPDGYEPRRVTTVDGENTGAIPTSPVATVRGRVTSGGDGVSGATLVWTGSDGARVVVATLDDGTYDIPDPK